MPNNAIILSVPPDLRFTETVENFVDVILPHLSAKNSLMLAQQLRSILNEAFVNVIRHAPQNLEQFVQVIFEVDQPRLMIYFPDQGGGIQVNGYAPPYPSELIGSSHVLLKTIDGEVMGLVEDKNSVLLSFKEEKNDEEKTDMKQLLESVKEGGMGLSLITKLMDRVRFVFIEGEGNRLEITKTIEQSKNSS